MSITSLVNRVRVQRGVAQRLAEVDNLLDTPSNLPKQTVQNAIYDSPLIMGLEEGAEATATRVDLKPPKADEIFLPEGYGDTLARLETPYTAPNTPASLLQGSHPPRDPVLDEFDFGSRPGAAGLSPDELSNLEFNFTPSQLVPQGYRGPTPTNEDIASMLSQLTPDDMAKIHRGNLKASHPDLSEEAIDQLVAQGGMRGGIERLGAVNAPEGPQSISELLQTRAAKDFLYMNDVKGMESPGFRLTPEQQARVDTIERSDYLNQAARNIRAVETADANRALMGRGPLGGYGDDLPAMRNQEVLDQIGYNETAHTNANLATATENLTEGASSGNFTPGRLNIGGTQATNSLLGSLDRAGAEGMLATMGLGAVLGGTANYAMGGEFGEGAMMGGLAGGGISIGARAIRANAQGIEGYLQRQVLGDTATNNRVTDAAAIAGMTDEAASNLSVGGRMARSALMRNPETASLQSRHMVVGGSMLAGVAFTGRRNDKRRGFNAHRGNRI